LVQIHLRTLKQIEMKSILMQVVDGEGVRVGLYMVPEDKTDSFGKLFTDLEEKYYQANSDELQDDIDKELETLGIERVFTDDDEIVANHL